MNTPIHSVPVPTILQEIPAPPQELYHCGRSLDALLKRPRVAIVGSRNMTAYGKQVTLQLAERLAEQGIVIVSGLAMGIDCTAHEATLAVGGLAIAVLPSPLNNIVPVMNRHLAERMLAQGGALVSEYAPGLPPLKQNFIARNRLMSGLADAVLITEAGEKSGALHTARFALEQGRDVMAVPGNITNATSIGSNNLLKSGAVPVTNYEDVLQVLGLTAHETTAHQIRGRNANEQTVLDLLLEGISSGDELLQASGLDVSAFNQVLTMLEISAKIRPLGANHWSLR